MNKGTIVAICVAFAAGLLLRDYLTPWQHKATVRTLDWGSAVLAQDRLGERSMFYGDRSLYDARGSCFQNARLVSVNSDLDQQVVFATWRCEAVTVDGNEIVGQLITEAFGRNNSCHQKASYWYVVTRKSEPLPRYGVDFARNC